MNTFREILRLAGFILLVGGGASMPVSGQIWQQYRNLEGHWRFSIGDDPDWKQADLNDQDWDYLKVPDAWEKQGYDGYNGYAWYRKSISLKGVPQDQLFLRIGAIDDADEVYLNGRLVSRSGSFPPNTETAWSEERSYRIPASYWTVGENVLAIKVYDFYNEGGIIRHPVGLYVDETVRFLSVDLSGEWNFTTAYHHIREGVDPADSKWTTIQVPGYWDKQGWPDFDGAAWYSRTFACHEGLKGEELFLVLGRIDDQEIVFLNGQKVGDTKSLRRRKSFWDRTEDYRLFRAYRLPQDVINYKSPNTLTLKVNDLMGEGGIYEGPVGIMTRVQLETFYQLRSSQQGVMDSFWEWLLD